MPRTHQRNCAWCGAPFEVRADTPNRRKYCPDKPCKRDAENARRRASAPDLARALGLRSTARSLRSDAHALRRRSAEALRDATALDDHATGLELHAAKILGQTPHGLTELRGGLADRQHAALELARAFGVIAAELARQVAHLDTQIQAPLPLDGTDD